MNTVKIIRAFGIKVWFTGDLFGKFTVNLAKCIDTGRFVKIADAVARLSRMVVCGMTTQVRDDMRKHLVSLYGKITTTAKLANATGNATAHKLTESMLLQYAEMSDGMTW
jgi:hypothetical protein